MLENITAYLDKDGVRYTSNTDDNIIRFSSRMSNAIFECSAQWKKSLSALVVYTIFAPIIPFNKRWFMGEIINRINDGLLMGNYEISYKDGIIRFKTSVDLEEVTFQENIVRNLFDATLQISDSYFPLLIEALSTELTPEELYNKFEEKIHSEENTPEQNSPE